MDYKLKGDSEYIPLSSNPPSYSEPAYFTLSTLLTLLHLYTRKYVRMRWWCMCICLSLYLYRVPDWVSIMMYISIMFIGTFTLRKTIQLNYQFTNLPYQPIHSEDISEGVSEYSYWMMSMSLVLWAHLQAWLGVWVRLPIFILFLGTIVIYVYNSLVKAAEANAPSEPLSKNKFQ